MCLALKLERERDEKRKNRMNEKTTEIRSRNRRNSPEVENKQLAQTSAGPGCCPGSKGHEEQDNQFAPSRSGPDSHPQTSGSEPEPEPEPKSES